MVDVTFVVPVGPYHTDLLARALASIEAQTVPKAMISVVVVHDSARRGAGYARNRGLERVTTEFVVWLDADDEVLPDFVEAALAAYQQQNNERTYVYTDWYDEGNPDPVRAPARPWLAGTRNVITTLLRTEDARRVGGFDETLAGLEDTDWYLRLLLSGVCPRHVARPLFRYGRGGQRSSAFYATAEFHAAMRRFSTAYPMVEERVMTCCGENEDGLQPLAGGLPGDVKAIAAWGGNRVVRGMTTGRLYPRTGNGKVEWVDPRDVDAMPHLWRRVADPIPPVTPFAVPQRTATPPTVITLDTADADPNPDPTPDIPVLEGVKALGARLFRAAPEGAAGLIHPAFLPPPPKDTTPRNPASAKPNARKARELYQKTAERRANG